MENNKKNKKLPVWVWVVGIILAILLIIFFTKPIADSEVLDLEKPEADTINRVPSEVLDFLNFVEEVTTGEKKADKYTSLGLEKMANAIAQMAKATDSYWPEAYSFRSRAIATSAFIKGNIPLEVKIDSLHSTFVTASEIIGKIQEEKFPGLASDVQNLKISAKMMDSTILSLGQQEATENFFRESAYILRIMLEQSQNN